MTLKTPRRRITLQFSHIRLTDERTFITMLHRQTQFPIPRPPVQFARPGYFKCRQFKQQLTRRTVASSASPDFESVKHPA